MGRLLSAAKAKQDHLWFFCSKPEHKTGAFIQRLSGEVLNLLGSAGICFEHVVIENALDNGQARINTLELLMNSWLLPQVCAKMWRTHFVTCVIVLYFYLTRPCCFQEIHIYIEKENCTFLSLSPMVPFYSINFHLDIHLPSCFCTSDSGSQKFC